MNLSFVLTLIIPLQLTFAKDSFFHTLYNLKFQSENQKILHSFLSESARVTIRSNWINVNKENANVAPKTFLRYFKLKPKAQKLFPDFADIDPTDLSTNDAFTARAGTCVSALNSQMKHLGENPKKCPFLGASIAAKHYHSDLKLLGATLIGVLEEELGDRFSTISTESWRKGLKALGAAVLKR